MYNSHVWITVAIIALVTASLRFLPFVLFGKGRKIPKVIEKLGALLPFSVMGMLVVYCLKGISFTSLSGFMPALIACAVVAILHLIFKKSLVSIISGTVVYMLLVQLVF